MSIYKQFKTDETLERNGIVIDYGEARVTMARAGGANKRFAKVLEAMSKPYRRAMQAETMDNDKAIDILRQVYAKTIILLWETKVLVKGGKDGKDEYEWKRGIESPDGGDLLPFNEENVILTLRALPEIFLDLQEQANKLALFRETILQDEAGN